MKEKVKEFLAELPVEKVKEFFKKYWMVFVNYIVIFIAYSTVYDKGLSSTELILGLWIFVSAAVGLFKWFKK